MGKSLKDVSRKNAEKRAHLESMPFETTPAQRLMRSEMEAGVHKPQVFDSEVLQEAARTAKLAGVLDDLMGTVSDDDVAELAHKLIEVHGQGLYLGLKQWGIVQRVVEAAVRAGIDIPKPD